MSGLESKVIVPNAADVKASELNTAECNAAELNPAQFDHAGLEKDNPLRRGLYASLSLLESQNPSLPRLGEALRPHLEPARVGQWPFMNFAVRELAQVESQGGCPVCTFKTLAFLGHRAPCLCI